MMDIIKILKDVIENSEYRVYLDSIEKLNDTDFKLIIDSCDLDKNNTLWIRECLIITINNRKYKVIEFLEDDYFVLQKMTSSTADIDTNLEFITLDTPSFFHGTVPASNIEISRDCITMPLVYFYEIFETRKQNRENVLDKIVFNARLFFLNDYEDEWLTDDHYNNVIYQMQKFMFLFIENLKANKYIDEEYIDVNGYTYKNRAKLGSFKGSKGNEKGLFDRKLSGVELTINLPIKRIKECNC